ncbi:HET-domain-containing protein [Daldinia bambusicola]|nr:HET-domain-containing protein [Daldinia bambusicola]
MTECYMHRDLPGDSSFSVGGFTLHEMAHRQFGAFGQPKCLICGAILQTLLRCWPGHMVEFYEVPWSSIMIQIMKFDRLQRVTVFNSEPLTSEHLHKVFSFEFIRRSFGITPRTQNLVKPPELDEFGTETAWAEMSQAWDVLEDSGAKTAFDRAAGWLSYCMKHDESCNPPDKMFVPRRLLDVGSSDQVEPFLFEPTKPTAYACLSYCWGKDVEDVLKTTTSNLNDHYKEVPLNSMPRTLRDAVMVCRGLGILYLWADSICIIQDDYDAWHQDAGMMDRIYLNSQVTISALEPSDCKTGFLGKQKFGLPGWQREVKISDLQEKFIARPRVDKTREFSLDKRGWCLQEAVLSRRRLCFDGNEMSWECLCRKVCECGHYIWPKFGAMETPYEFNAVQFGALLQGIASKSMPSQKMDVYSLGVSERHNYWLTGKGGTNHPNGGPGRIYDLWRNLASNYSRRSVSRQGDKLVALTGLANIMREANQHEANAENGYLAGLWKTELHFDLAWRVASFKLRPIPSVDKESNFVEQTHRFLSWSWASCDGVITYYDYISPWLDWVGGFPSGLSVVDKCSTEGIEGIAKDGTPTDEGSRVSLKGALLPVELAIFGNYIPPKSPFTPCREADVFPFHSGYPRNDMPDISAFIRSRTLYSARVYLDEHADPTISDEDPGASCWTNGRCQEHCCSWNKGQDETIYYCFRLFSWVLNSETSAQSIGGFYEEKREIETWFLVLKLSRRVKGAFERIGVGVWAGQRGSNWGIKDSNPFTMATMEVIDII